MLTSAVNFEHDTQFFLLYVSQGARLFCLKAHNNINEMLKVNFDTTTENEIAAMNNMEVYFSKHRK